MPFPPLPAILLGALAAPTAAADEPALVPACRALAAAVAPAPLVADLTAALAVHGGAVRWEPAEGARPLVVWLQPRPRRLVPSLHTEGEWRAALADGVVAWSDVVPGLRVALGRDSATADVRVVWTATLPPAEAGDPAAGARGAPAALTAGRTLLDPDPSGRAVRATVRFAAAAGDGAPYLPADVRAVARHEMGHVLGLAHHAAATSVMAPLVRAERIGRTDLGDSHHGSLRRVLSVVAIVGAIPPDPYDRSFMLLMPARARSRPRHAAPPDAAVSRRGGPELAFPQARAAEVRRRIIDNWRRARCSRDADTGDSLVGARSSR